MNQSEVYIIGDIHGQYSILMDCVISSGISNATLMCVGDLGIGFDSEEKTIACCKRLNDFF